MIGLLLMPLEASKKDCSRKTDRLLAFLAAVPHIAYISPENIRKLACRFRTTHNVMNLLIKNKLYAKLDNNGEDNTS